MTDLSVDPSGNPACSTRKVMAWLLFGGGLAFMAGDLWLNSGTNLQTLATFTASGPALYKLARANHEYQVRKNGAG